MIMKLHGKQQVIILLKERLLKKSWNVVTVKSDNSNLYGRK